MKRYGLIYIIISISLTGFGQSLTDSLVLYLPFSGNIADNSGNEYIVTNSGATLASDRFGNENSAYYFNGTANMKISSSQNLPNINSDGYTISFWVRQDTSAADNGTVLSHNSYSFSYSTDVYYLITAYTVYSIIREGEYDRFLEENWNMLTLTYYNGIMKSYVNGGLVEEKEVTGTASSGHDFVIGNSTTCWIDDITVYNRCLNDLEVAQLSGLSGAIRAAKLNAFLVSDFERGDLNPAKYVGGKDGTSNWHIYGHVGDDLSYCTTVENPIKSDANPSDFCMAAVTFPTTCSGNLMSEVTPSRKQEYTIYTPDGDMGDHHHIYQWKVMMYDSTVLKLDSMMWFTNNQIAGNFQLYDGDCYAFAGEKGGIYYSGGIFNDNEKEVVPDYVNDPEKRLEWYFRFRVLPDTALVRYKYDIGKWMTFTYDIFWTKTDTGYWRLYKDGELISSRDNAQTLPDCAPDNESLHLAHKFGIYTRWNDYIDNEIDSLIVYFDDIEFYLDPENDKINISDICPECDNSYNTSITNGKGYGQLLIFPNPVRDYLNIQGETIPSGITIYSCDGKKLKYAENTNTVNISDLKTGIYIVIVNIQESFVTRKMIKENL